MNNDNWRDMAACKGLDVNMFFPTKGQSLQPARNICNQCPVTTQCRTASYDSYDGSVEKGVWAGDGHNERERQRIQLRGRNPRGPKPRPISHGTPGGYLAHYRQRQFPVCEPCRQANSALRTGYKTKGLAS